jgi:glycosyltransferase involved in cell wall biosynthesis
VSHVVIDDDQSEVSADQVDISFVIPCLDEAESLGHVIDEIAAAYRDGPLSYEILVADNGSTDGSQQIALDRGARVEDVPRRGYGAALLGGIAAARGRYVVMGDADGSYVFGDAAPMFEKLRDGADVVMGNRFAGGIEPRAMPVLHRYVGNPVLSALGRMFFGLTVRDFHCGLRAFKREKIIDLGLKTSGMEFASEMLVRSKKARYRIDEVPVRLLRDQRTRSPHLRTFRDGWRHIRFLLLYAPKWTFFLPAAVCGAISLTLAIAGPLTLGSVQFSYRASIVVSAMASIATAGGWASYAASVALGEERRRISTEAMALASGLVAAIGFGLLVAEAVSWQGAGFGDQAVGRGTLLTVAGGFLLVAGGISFVFSLLVGLIRNLR